MSTTPAPASPKDASRSTAAPRTGSWPEGGAGAGADRLPLEVLVAASELALRLEQLFEWAHKTTGQGEWPAGCCVEASFTLYEDLERELPAAGAEYVWGNFIFGGRRIGHAWVELRDGTIVDLTAGQFTLGLTPALAFVPPGHALASHYDARARGLPGKGDG